MHEHPTDAFGHKLFAAIADETPIWSDSRIDVVDAELVAPPPQQRSWSRWVWAIAASWPMLGFAAWLWASVRRGEVRLLFHALVYAIWPFVAVAGVEIFANLFVAEPNLPADEWTVADAPNSVVIEGWLIIAAIGATWTIAARVAASEWRRWYSDQSNVEPTSSPDLLERIEGLTHLDEFDYEFTTRSRWICIVLWLTCGWLGVHRFYTGRTISGVLYACTGGLAGIGWAADLLLLDTMSKRSIHPRRDTQQPAWAVESKRLGIFDFLLRMVFFTIAPMVFTLACVMYNHFELLAVLALVVVPCAFLGNAGRSLNRLEAVGRLPIIGTALGFVKNLNAFYFEHAPRSFLYYVFYPFACPLASIWSSSARRELRLYSGFIGTLILVVVIKYAAEYPSTFPPFLGFADAFGFALMHAVFAIFGTIVLLLPMTATSFSYHFTGRRLRLRVLAAIAIMVTIPVGIATYTLDRHSGGATTLSQMMLEFRMENDAFRGELRHASEMFLRHHVEDANRFYGPTAASITTPREHGELTEKYRRLVSGLATRDEANAFRVFILPNNDPAGPRGSWLGIHATIDPPFVLAVIRPDGRFADDGFVTRWDDLPDTFRSRLTFDPAASATDSDVARIAAARLIDDWR